MGKLSFQKTCIICRKEYLAGHRSKTCSENCRAEHRRKISCPEPKAGPADSLHRKKEEDLARKRKLLTKQCKNCNQEFQTREPKTKLCSRKCIAEQRSISDKNPDVILSCVVCKNDFTVSYSHRKRICCSTVCTAINANLTRDKEAASKKLSESLKEYFKTHKNVWLGKKHKEESKQKIREKRIKRPPTKTRFKSGLYFSSKLNREIQYRSGWEMKFYKSLDLDESVLIYDVESIQIQYFYKQYRYYFPDILITYKNGTRKLVEIKPERYLSKKKNIEKFKSAQNYCINHGMIFEVWTENKNPYYSKQELTTR